MPLTQVSEQAATRIQALLDSYDRRLERYITSGGTPPNPDTLEAEVTRLVRASIVSGLLEVDPTVTDPEIDAMILATVASIMQATRASTRSAILLRTRITQAQTVDTEGRSVAGLVRDFGPLVAFASLLAAGRRITRRTELERLARNARVRMPSRTASYARMRIRTDTAIVRNVRASQVVERLNQQENRFGYQTGDWVLYVRDNLIGYDDEPCSAVDRKLATPQWARNHPVAHPSCTRRTTPYRLRAGDVVTLLS